MTERTPEEIAAGRLTIAQRKAMASLGALGTANESVIQSLCRLGLVAEYDVPDLLGMKGESIDFMRDVGIKLVANAFTEFGERVRTLIEKESRRG